MQTLFKKHVFPSRKLIEKFPIAVFGQDPTNRKALAKDDAQNPKAVRETKKQRVKHSDQDSLKSSVSLKSSLTQEGGEDGRKHELKMNPGAKLIGRTEFYQMHSGQDEDEPEVVDVNLKERQEIHHKEIGEVKADKHPGDFDEDDGNKWDLNGMNRQMQQTDYAQINSNGQRSG